MARARSIAGAFLALPLGAALASAGCAEREVVTWDDAAPTHASLASPDALVDDAPVDAPPKKRRRTSRALPPELRAGDAIDRALARFRASRAAMTSAPRTSAVHGEQWLEVLEEIDQACLIAPTAADLGAFVRARVTLDVELHVDRERRRVLPSDLGERIQHALASVDARVNELRMSGAAGTVLPSAPLHDGAVVLHAPLAPMVVTSEFGVRKDPVHGRRRFHAGIDLGAPEGTMLYSAAPGIVIYAARQGGFGRHVVVDHGHGIRTHYSHLSQIFVKPGEIVEAGDTLGAVGSTGRATGPHLHFAVTNADGHFLDPLTLFGIPLGDDTGPTRARHGKRRSPRVSLAK